MKKQVIIYTDGACSGNPGPGGWGAYLIYENHKKEIYGHDLDTTNNRMEIMSVIMGLQSLKEECLVDIYTDSSYVKNAVTLWMNGWIKNGWRTADKKPVKNIDLWQILNSELAKHEVSWHWVKGHSGNLGNEIADSLAVRGRDEAIKILKHKVN
jgi:ribonuclease HI